MFTILFLSALCAWVSVYSISNQQNDGQGELANSDGNQAALGANLHTFENDGNTVSRGKRAILKSQAWVAFETFFRNDANAVARPKGVVPADRIGDFSTRLPRRANRTRAPGNYRAALGGGKGLSGFFRVALVTNTKGNDYLLRPLVRNNKGNNYLLRPLVRNIKGNDYLLRPLVRNKKVNDYLLRSLVRYNKGNDNLLRALVITYKENDYLLIPLVRIYQGNDYLGLPFDNSNKFNDYLGRLLARPKELNDYNRPPFDQINGLSNYYRPVGFGDRPLHSINEAATPRESVLPNNVRVVWKNKGGLNKVSASRQYTSVKGNVFDWNSHLAKFTRPIKLNSPIVRVNLAKGIRSTTPVRHVGPYIQIGRSWRRRTSPKKKAIRLGWF